MPKGISSDFQNIILIASFKIKIVSINPVTQRISIRNFLTLQLPIYLFSELDGFQDMIVNHGRGGTSYKTIGISKDGKVILKIDSYYYSNIDEMREALQGMKYLGINIKWNKQKFN